MLSQVLIKNDKGNYVNFRSLAPKDEFINYNEVIRPLPKQTGSGHFSSFSICEGLDLGICRCRFDEDYMAKFTFENPLLSLGFYIKGHSLSWSRWMSSKLSPFSKNNFLIFPQNPLMTSDGLFEDPFSPMRDFC